jgi:DNA-binding beta-propeller fold protein YncE
MTRFTTMTIFASLLTAAAFAGEPRSYLETVRRHNTRSSTIAENGDTNPYAIVIAPVSAGKIQQGDVLVDNFNNSSNLQGTGTTIVDYRPSNGKAIQFAKLPARLPQCPGGIGLTAAMAMLKTGWVIVGSTPSTDGTTRTKGPGALLVLDPDGQLAAVWTGPKIDGPWGNMAVVDRGSTATLFISMAGFDVPGPEIRDPDTGFPITLKKATVLRIELSIPDGKPPVITSQTVIADGLSQRADKDAFLIGPTGLALGPDDTLYASDALANQIIAIPQASKRATSAGLGRVITRDKLLRRPLAMVFAPNGHLLVCNGTNGQVVEVDPVAGKQICAQWIDADQAQSPPGNGDLFGLAVSPDGNGLYYVEDDNNTLMEAGK